MYVNHWNKYCKKGERDKLILYKRGLKKKKNKRGKNSSNNNNNNNINKKCHQLNMFLIYYNF